MELIQNNLNWIFETKILILTCSREISSSLSKSSREGVIFFFQDEASSESFLLREMWSNLISTDSLEELS